jgi:bacterioferritin-associated ferredoxin
MFVCVCNKVTDSDIREACDNGASSLNCLKDRLKVATCCGRCEDCAKRVLRDAQVERHFTSLSLATA